MQRRAFLWTSIALPLTGRAQGTVLSLYGLALKDAPLSDFVAAVQAVGAQPLTAPSGVAAAFDVRGGGVPALLQLSVTAHDGRVARVRFSVKAYGEDNLALRQLLLEKYGPPLTVSPRPMSFGGFGDRGSPRGGFQWRFDDGLRLVYEHPALGDVTLSYVDDAAMAKVDSPAAPPDLNSRF